MDKERLHWVLHFSEVQAVGHFLFFCFLIFPLKFWDQTTVEVLNFRQRGKDDEKQHLKKSICMSHSLCLPSHGFMIISLVTFLSVTENP